VTDTGLSGYSLRKRCAAREGMVRLMTGGAGDHAIRGEAPIEKENLAKLGAIL
jgi:hypothetical protein